jgi:uncharacterized protein
MGAAPMQVRPPSAKWTPVRVLWFALGLVFAALGLVGIVIPLLPTTPFLIVAVWAFGKSSPAFAERVRNHRLFGPYVRNWEQHRVIPLGAKILACSMMAASMFYIVWFTPAPWWAEVVAAAILAAASAYILTKPNAPL